MAHVSGEEVWVVTVPYLPSPNPAGHSAAFAKLFKWKNKAHMWSGIAEVLKLHRDSSPSSGTEQGDSVSLPDPEEESIWAQEPVLRRKMTLGCGHSRETEAKGCSTSSLTALTLLTHPGKVARHLHWYLSQSALEGADSCCLLLSPLQDRSGSGSEED